MKKVYFLIVLFLSGLSVENVFAAAPTQTQTPTPTWADWARSLLPGAGTRDLDRELLEAATETHPNKAKIERLIKEGANPNTTTDINGYTVLMLIAEKQDHYIDTVQLLIDAGADVNATNKTGMTVLMDAAGHRNENIVKLLLDAGAEVNAQQEKNLKVTALMNAAASGHTDTVDLLLDAGADMNVQDLAGNTALIWATILGHDDVVKQLLDHGADKNIKNKRKETAEKLARSHGQNELADMIRDYTPSGGRTKSALKR